jgi:hypothetical protein
MRFCPPPKQDYRASFSSLVWWWDLASVEALKPYERNAQQHEAVETGDQELTFNPIHEKSSKFEV